MILALNMEASCICSVLECIVLKWCYFRCCSHVCQFYFSLYNVVYFYSLEYMQRMRKKLVSNFTSTPELMELIVRLLFSIHPFFTHYGSVRWLVATNIYTWYKETNNKFCCCCRSNHNKANTMSTHCSILYTAIDSMEKRRAIIISQ